jgi:hypothetical protein
MAILISDLRQKAPTPMLALAFETVMRTEPILNWLGFDAVSGDRVTYRRARGAATAAFFNADATMTDGTDESFDPLEAVIRPIGGHIQVPVIGGANASVNDHIKAKTRAVVWSFMNALINGNFPVGTIPAPWAAAYGALTLGPYFELTTRGGACVLRANVTNPAGPVTLQLKAYGDIAFGTASADVTADAGATARVLYSQNPNIWISCLPVGATFAAMATGTYDVAVAVTSTTNEFDGLLQLVTNTASMIAMPSAAAEAFDLEHLDLLLQQTRTGGRKVFLAAERTQRAFLAEMRALGGVTWTEVAGKKVPEYNGVPFLTSTYMPITRTYAGTANCGVVFCLDLDEGVRGLFRSANGSAEYDGRSFGGLRIRNLGEVITNAENELIRLTAHWSIAHLSLPGVTCIDGFTN